MKKPKILVVGSVNKDIVVDIDRMPLPGETVHGRAITFANGGKGANQAMQAARLGADVTFVGRTGNDAFGDELRHGIEAENIDISRLTSDEDMPTGTCFITIEHSGGAQNRIIALPAANMTLEPSHVSFLEDCMDTFDMVLLQQEIPEYVNEAVADCAARHSVPVMLNPAPYRPVSEKLIKNVAYISPNETELLSMCGVEIEASDGHICLESAEEAAKALSVYGVPHMLVTLGALGSLYTDGSKTRQFPCADGINAVDPTAAGDSFVASFCVGRCIGLDIDEAMTFATYAAAITVSGFGAQPSLPYMASVIALLEDRGAKVTLVKKLRKLLA